MTAAGHGPDPESGPGPEVRLRRLSGCTALALTTRGPYWRLSGALERLKSLTAEIGAAPTGPLFGIFHDDPERLPPQATRYTLAYPLDETGVTAARSAGWPTRRIRRGSAVPSADESAGGAQAAGDDVVEVLEFPATEAAAAEYRGPAAGSPLVYALVADWVERNGYLAAGPPREVYLAEPGALGGGLMHAEVRQPVVSRPAPAG